AVRLRLALCGGDGDHQVAELARLALLWKTQHVRRPVLAPVVPVQRPDEVVVAKDQRELHLRRGALRAQKGGQELPKPSPEYLQAPSGPPLVPYDQFHPLPI